MNTPFLNEDELSVISPEFRNSRGIPVSAISVKAGQPVKKGDVIGNSGTTGLAGGDHLHFGRLAGGQFVNPVEWWDPHWIKDNVTDKLAQK